MEQPEQHKKQAVVKTRLLIKCELLYASMAGEAIETIDGLIWTGSLSQAVSNIDKTTSNYTHIINALKDMGCIQQLRKGGGHYNSVVRLLRPPSIELSANIRKISAGSKANQAVDSQVLVLATRVSELEQKLDVLIRYVQRNVPNTANTPATPVEPPEEKDNDASS